MHDRFLSLKEKNILLRNSVNFNYLLYLRKLCLYWTAKEALFKLIDKQNISSKKTYKSLE
ncbi:MAG: 4'-phosphopantetheinyl transferase superfamily protein [Solitalea-like symbiont of Acarus siro]